MGLILLGLPFPLPGGLTLYDPLSEGKKPVNFVNPGSAISVLLPYLFIIGGLILLVMLLLGGFEIMTSIGNEEKTKAGFERIKNALTGFLLLFGVFWLAQIAQVLFKIPIL